MTNDEEVKNFITELNGQFDKCNRKVNKRKLDTFTDEDIFFIYTNAKIGKPQEATAFQFGVSVATLRRRLYEPKNAKAHFAFKLGYHEFTTKVFSKQLERLDDTTDRINTIHMVNRCLSWMMSNDKRMEELEMRNGELDSNNNGLPNMNFVFKDTGVLGIEELSIDETAFLKNETKIS